MTRILLHSPLDPVAAALKLKAAGEGAPPPGESKWVSGSGSERTMRLWVNRRNVRNDFKSILTAEMSPERGGTRIAGRIGRPRGVTIFMAVWIGFVSLFFLLGATLTVFGDDAGEVGLMFMAIPAGMIGMAVFMLWFGAWLSRGDEAMILAFLEKTIDARAGQAQDAGISR